MNRDGKVCFAATHIAQGLPNPVADAPARPVAKRAAKKPAKASK